MFVLRDWTAIRNLRASAPLASNINIKHQVFSLLLNTNRHNYENKDDNYLSFVKI